MTSKEQLAAAKKIAAYWNDRGQEKSEKESFWINLLHDVFGVEEAHTFVSFEKKVTIDGKEKYIDAYLPATNVLVEQKGANIQLRKSYKQSDGKELTPYGQAKRYNDNLPFRERARWIVVCNFRTFLVYDMERPGAAPEEILLEEFAKAPWRLAFLTAAGETRLQRETAVSLEAGELVHLLHEGLLARYGNEEPETLRAPRLLPLRRGRQSLPNPHRLPRLSRALRATRPAPRTP